MSQRWPGHSSARRGLPISCSPRPSTLLEAVLSVLQVRHRKAHDHLLNAMVHHMSIRMLRHCSQMTMWMPCGLHHPMGCIQTMQLLCLRPENTSSSKSRSQRPELTHSESSKHFTTAKPWQASAINSASIRPIVLSQMRLRMVAWVNWPSSDFTMRSVTRTARRVGAKIKK